MTGHLELVLRRISGNQNNLLPELVIFEGHFSKPPELSTTVVLKPLVLRTSLLIPKKKNE